MRRDMKAFDCPLFRGKSMKLTCSSAETLSVQGRCDGSETLLALLRKPKHITERSGPSLLSLRYRSYYRASKLRAIGPTDRTNLPDERRPTDECAPTLSRH